MGGGTDPAARTGPSHASVHYITRKVVVSLSRSVCVRDSTVLGTCKMCALSEDFAPFGQRPYIYSKGLFTDKLCLSRTWMTNIHNEHVAR